MGRLRPRRGRTILALTLTFVLLVGCGVLLWRTGGGTQQGWRAPDPARPVLDLTYRVASDLRSATGREHLEFRLDRSVCELVWRAWPNKPVTARAGNSLTVTQVRLGPAPVPFSVQAAGAPEGQPGTLIEVPLAPCVPAGQLIVAELDFSLTLGSGTDERIGVSRSGQVAWLGSAFPLLAWERGRGWAREPAVAVLGETATSEVFQLRSLQVSASSAYAVAGVGQLVGATPDANNGTTTHEYTAEALRDVAVTVGRLDTLVRQVGHVTVHVAAPPYPGRLELPQWADEIERAIQRLEDYLGPFPYSDLWVSHLPDQTEGIEFPGAVQLGRLAFPSQRYVVSHELAHQYFYGLVGNNQAVSPWLDESVTTLVQEVIDAPQRNPSPDQRYGPWFRNHWGQSMSEWQAVSSANERYQTGVYVAGPDALIEARRAVGAESFDQALRQYLRDHAQSIATPADFARAFEGLPPVTQALQTGQALGDSRA